MSGNGIDNKICTERIDSMVTKHQWKMQAHDDIDTSDVKIDSILLISNGQTCSFPRCSNVANTECANCGQPYCTSHLKFVGDNAVCVICVDKYR